AAASIFLSDIALAADAVGCASSEQQLGMCTSGNSTGTGVDVVGVRVEHEEGRSAAATPSSARRPLTQQELIDLWNEMCVGAGDCGAARVGNLLNPLLPPPAPAAPGAPGAQPRVITAADVARFLPATGVLHTEPREWAVVGVPANFWVDVQAVTVSGTLLGGPADVRFTPQAFRWTYGDGTTRTTASPGASWASLGQDELTTTPTSHAYGGRGDRRASAQVVYSAAYRIGGGPWSPVVGAVFGRTPSARMLVVTERTVLTAGAG
ncbi:MAG: hypothetical protein QOC59_437, partial [Microbacteriaceae bacterium]|nr:hypothetical protein [Microbacteriaceae bacterium]